MSKVDWSSIGSEDNSKGGSGGKSDIVFLNSKNLPKTFLPDTDVEEYYSVYVKEENRSRMPEDGEKGDRHFLFYALFVDDDGKKTIKIADTKTQVAQQIGQIMNVLKDQVGEDATSFVEVTSSGSGLKTEYKVKTKKIGDKPVKNSIWDKLKESEQFKALPSLIEIRDRLLGLNKDDEDNSGSEGVDDSDSVDDLDI